MSGACEIVLGEVTTAITSVLTNIAQDVGQLHRDPQRARVTQGVCVHGRATLDAEHVGAHLADGARHALTIGGELLPSSVVGRGAIARHAVEQLEEHVRGHGVPLQCLCELAVQGDGQRLAQAVS